MSLINLKDAYGFVSAKRNKSVLQRLHSGFVSPTLSSFDSYQIKFEKIDKYARPQNIGQLREGNRQNSIVCFSVQQSSYILLNKKVRKSRLRKLKSSMNRHFSFRNKEQNNEQKHRLKYDFEYNEISINPANLNQVNSLETKFVLLLHPIGVGISKWYYDDLLAQFTKKSSLMKKKYVFLVPDLLGCGSGCNPTKIEESEEENVKKLPLLYPEDWAGQMIDFMTQYESNYAESFPQRNTSWAIVANGGCVSIALRIAKHRVNQIKHQSKESTQPSPLCSIILSAVPSLESMVTKSNPNKVKKAYLNLSGILGDVFWWYSLRNDGQFIQTFSEKNLAASPENLGKDWRSRCVQTARMFNGKSRFATFSFLAGSLKEDCKDSLDVLKESDVRIDVIRGEDKRKNSSRSWFWEKQNKKNSLKGTLLNSDGNREKKVQQNDVDRMAFPKLLQKNGNGGNVTIVGGRICLAQEDPDGFSNAVIKSL